MFDHIMLRTQQFEIMSAFYEKALAPLGIKKLMGLRVSAEDEINGLDIAEMGMEAYPDAAEFEGRARAALGNSGPG